VTPFQSTRRKKLVGDFKYNGREWRPKGEPEEVRVHDFMIKELSRAVPYGITIWTTTTVGSLSA